MASSLLVGIDIGTYSVKVAVAEQKNGKPALRMLFKEPSRGLRRGAIVDLAEISQVLSRVLAEVKKISKSAIKNLYVSVGTAHLKSNPSGGVVAVSRADSEIYQDDIDRAVRASQAVTLPANWMVLHNITQEFVVDGVGDVAEPLGLNGNRLEVKSLIVSGFAAHVKAIMRAIELSGGAIGGLVCAPIASSRAVLSKRQKDIGTVLIDVGGGTTSMAVYEEGKLVGVANIPVGAGNVSNDLAVALKIPIDAAESVKLHYGHAVEKSVGAKEVVDLKKFAPDAKGGTSRQFIANIMELRLAEIFELINNELRSLGRAGQLAGGAVLTGGGAKLPGLTELARQELKLASQVGLSESGDWDVPSGELSMLFEDPEFATVLGLILWGADQERWWPSVSAGFSPKRIFRFFMP